MLSPGLELCPRCGRSLEKKEGTSIFERKDYIVWTLYALGIVLIPLILIILISVICVNTGKDLI
jgi:hypothetical protein